MTKKLVPRKTPSSFIAYPDEDSDGLLDNIDTQDDFDFRHAQSFLEADLSNSSSRNSKKKTKSFEDERREYEDSARKWVDEVENGSGHLLVRDNTGKWTVPKSKGQSSETEDSEPEVEVGKVSEATKPKITTKEWALELSHIAKAIIEKPEENAGKLKRLPGFFKCKDPQRKMIGIASTVAVYRDILPSYLIRELTETEKSVKVSKDVQAARNLETTLLSSYFEFIQFCKGEFSKKNDQLSFKALCELCRSSSVRSFNHFDSILSVVASAAVVNSSEKIRLAGCRALKSLFSESTDDSSGRLTMFALKSISNALRERSYSVRDAQLFEALEGVRLKSPESFSVKPDAPQVDHTKTHSHLSKKERKEEKEKKKDVRKKAVDVANESRKQQQKWARECREHLFGILFGFLKSEEKNDKLLSACMSALSKFAPFLGIEYFADLTSVIKSLCSSSSVMSFNLYCILTVLKMSSFQEVTSSLDLKFFFDLYYRLLKGPTKQLAENLDLVSEVFTLLFKSKRTIPKERVASFAHRILHVITLSVKGQAKMLFVGQLCDLFQHYPSIRVLLDDDTLGNGIYLDDCDNPDICKPFCKQLQLKTLSNDPECGHLIKKILKG